MHGGAFPHQRQALRRGRVADGLGELGTDRLPVGRDGRDQGLQVGRADDVHAAGVGVRVSRHAGQHGVAAVAAAHDGDARGVRNPFRHRPGHGVQQVVVHAPAPLPVAGVDEALAEAGGAAEVDREHGVAAVGEPLVVRVEPEPVAPPGAAVDQQHQRTGAVRAAQRLWGPGQVRYQAQPVARAERDGPHGRQWRAR